MGLFDVATAAAPALGALAGRSTKVSTSQSAALSANIAFNPSIGISTGPGAASPSSGGSASGSPASSASSAIPADQFPFLSGFDQGTGVRFAADQIQPEAMGLFGSGGLNLNTLLLIGGGLAIVAVLLTMGK